MYKLYYRRQFMNEHASFEEARHEACSIYLEYQSMTWEGSGLPPGFVVSCQGDRQDQLSELSPTSDGVLW